MSAYFISDQETGRTEHVSVEQLEAEMSFEQWMARVDRLLIRALGVTHRDIADWTWRDAYEDEVSPREAAQEALRNEFGS